MFMPASRAEFDLLVPDESAAERHLIQLRWPNGVSCPHCGSFAMTRNEERKNWQCRPCRKQTSVRSHTAMHRSHLPLRVWLYAIWRISRLPPVPATEIARELGIRYESVWLMLHKIRATLQGKGWPMAGPALCGTAEIPVPKVASGDPVDRPPVLVALLVSPDMEAPDTLRIEVARDPQPIDDELRDEARFQHLEPGAEVQVEPERKVKPTWGGRLGWAHRRLVRWLMRGFRGVSRRYLSNYLALYVYSDNRAHLTPQGGLARWVARRVLQDPWRPRSELALIGP